ncbi:protein TWIN LOV 1 isoform X2 [Ananas comosus]|uniref:Protein TWIN LOV 1 isoform X2 n=1 Tax=Ananas comosus TaxID=4615 RepID=A0A6P5FX38_ANACO|nr:protein TWIN LOV 1 isoform X2 [Ananas comosus]
MASSDDRSALARSLTSRYSEWIAEALDELPECFLITDPAIPGHPIVFASRGFLAMSGYAMDEVLGRNGRIFQGPATDRRSVMEIREAVREERTVQISLLNYRRDGTPHWILFHMCPVFEAAGSGRVAHFLAVQVPVPPRSRARSRSRSRSRWCGGATGMMLRACRNELLMDEGLGCSRAEESFVEMPSGGVEAEEPPVATDCEKEKAVNAANSIVSTLNRYSKITGRVVCGKRCCPVGVPLLSSSLIISLENGWISFRTDPHLPDMPIVYASDAFLTLTGYSRDEVLGRNCRFLNGPGTSLEVLKEIKDSICAGQACSVRLLNYRKDASSFWNLLHISPIRDASGKIAFYVGVQLEEGLKCSYNGLSPEMWQLGAVGAVKVAVRGSSLSAGPSRPSS